MASVAVAGRRASLASSTAVIAKRSLLKFWRTPQLVWTATIQGVLFLVGFRLHGGIGGGLLALVLIIVFSFTFEWVFIACGLYAGNAQAAQGLALILVPFTFVSSAYVPVSSMPGGLRAVAAHQPVTSMIESVRSLTGGERAAALLGHPASWFVARSLVWSAVLLVVFGSIAVAHYRRGRGLDGRRDSIDRCKQRLGCIRRKEVLRHG